MSESVWDYPRPPAIVPCDRPVRIEQGGVAVAESERALRVLETSSPPTIYLPAEDFAEGSLEPATNHSFCEWKGQASYYDVIGAAQRADQAAWYYPEPKPAFAALMDHVAVYPGRVDACYLDGERVRPQAGGFYGGWITDDIEGPFKGDPGTTHW